MTTSPSQPASGKEALPLKIFLIAGEPSGDQLGGKLMSALCELYEGDIHFSGVGGSTMEAEGLKSLFPLSDVAVMGAVEIIKALPRLIRCVYQTVNEARSIHPDLIIIIDSPEFTHPIAKRLKKIFPEIPIFNYVSPSVWAWRPHRAKRMVHYIDHILALLPFEPKAHKDLGGPKCSYVGHPLIEKMDWIQSRNPESLAHRLNLDPSKAVLVLLPGSRGSEVNLLMAPFGESLTGLLARFGPLEVIIPTFPALTPLIEKKSHNWPVTPHLIYDEEDKFAAFKLARAALVASGTATLQLALAGVPMVVAYRVDRLIAPFLRRMIYAKTVVLANLVLGETVFPEYLQEQCVAENLSAGLIPLLRGGEERERQLEAVSEVIKKMQLPAGTPSRAAAECVLGSLKERV